MESCHEFLDDWIYFSNDCLNDWSDGMRFLLLGKGKTTQAIAQFLKEMNQDVDFACKIEEKSNNDLLFDQSAFKIKKYRLCH